MNTVRIIEVKESVFANNDREAVEIAFYGSYFFGLVCAGYVRVLYVKAHS